MMKNKVIPKGSFVFLMLFLVNPFFTFAGVGEIDPNYLSNFVGYLLLGMGAIVILTAFIYLIKLFNVLIALRKK